MASSDQEARFRALWEAHYDSVLTFCLRRLPADQAEDVAGETFLSAWRRLPEVPDAARPWLFGAALGLIANRRRGRRRARALASRLAAERTQAAPDPADRLGDPELASALARLSSNDREALLLTYWEDLAPAVAAEVLGCSTRAFTVRLNRAHHRLRRQLADAAPAAVVDVVLGPPTREEIR